ncbi:DUF4867 family protein [Butyricicoccus sp.]|uniref:DUF4867 family protein n=1 Tax=Butyricicoccus sp. TaxID=2049021 RepID=UPI003F14B2C9
MKIHSVFDPEFAAYGSILSGYDTSELLHTLSAVTPLPEAVAYVASQPELEALPIFDQLCSNAFGGMPIQLGWCNGHNMKLNCLEYHRDSEINIGTQDFILLVAQRSEIHNGRLDTACVQAFHCPAGTVAELYATTLHYAPCSAAAGQGFRVAVVLPRGTNGPKPEITAVNPEDSMLWAANKWLLAHADSAEAAQGAVIALDGVNLDISSVL